MSPRTFGATCARARSEVPCGRTSHCLSLLELCRYLAQLTDRRACCRGCSRQPAGRDAEHGLAYDASAARQLCPPVGQLCQPLWPRDGAGEEMRVDRQPNRKPYLGSLSPSPHRTLDLGSHSPLPRVGQAAEGSPFAAAAGSPPADRTEELLDEWLHRARIRAYAARGSMPGQGHGAPHGMGALQSGLEQLVQMR